MLPLTSTTTQGGRTTLDFDRLWNKGPFNIQGDPRYFWYKKLHALGAHLTLIEDLRLMLQHADAVTAWRRQRSRAERKLEKFAQPFCQRCRDNGLATSHFIQLLGALMVPLKREKKSDRAGELFIFALALHLKRVSGRPHFRLVTGLLNALRMKNDVTGASITSVKVRAQKFRRFFFGYYAEQMEKAWAESAKETPMLHRMSLERRPVKIEQLTSIEPCLFCMMFQQTVIALICLPEAIATNDYQARYFIYPSTE
jgi:hypothetical protein